MDVLKEIDYLNVVSIVGKTKESGLEIRCKHLIAPVGEIVFAILGTDRIMYTPIDSEIGKEYAVRVVKQKAWNVKKVKVGKCKSCNSVRYGIPKSFARTLNLKKGQKVLVIGKNNTLEIIPMNVVIEKIGTFKEIIL